MCVCVCVCSESHSVTSDSLWPYGLYSPWNSPGQNTGVGSHSLLQGIFPTRGSNSGLPHCRCILYQLSHKGSHECVLKYFIIKRKSCTGDWAWADSECINNLHKQVAQKPKVPNSCYSTIFSPLGRINILSHGEFSTKNLRKKKVSWLTHSSAW